MEADRAGIAERKAETSSAALTGSWRPASVNLEARTAEVVFSTGASVLRFDPWTGREYEERLLISDKSVNLDRLRRGAPVLDSHDKASVRNQIGVVQDAWIANGAGHARIQFSRRADDVLQDVADGVIRNVSIGYSQDAIRKKKRDGKPELYVVTRWTPHEVSLVTVPADAAAQVRNQNYQTGASDGAAVRIGGTIIMEHEANEPAAVPVQSIETLERERCAFINRAAGALNQRELADKLITDGTPLEEASRKLIDAAAAEPSNDVEVNHRIHPDGGRRQRDFAKAAGAALLHRERVEITEDQAALSLSTRSMVELARMACDMDGVGVTAETGRVEIAKRALVSSTTLQDVIAHTAERSLHIGYEAVPRVFTDIFREVSASNFRPIERVKLADRPALPLVAEGDPYTEGTMSDSKESYSLASYGEIIGLTRQLIANDDVDAVTRVPTMLGNAAARRENAVAWGVLNTNGDMADSNSIFAAGTNNLTVGGLTAAVLEAVRQNMLEQESENGRKLGLQPIWLVVGADLLKDAEKLVRPPVSYSDSTLANSLSAQLANQVQLRFEPLIPAGTFYVFADYRQLDSCEFVYLEGQRGVYLERETDFATGALKLKATLDFGAAAIDRRTMHRVNAS